MHIGDDTFLAVEEITVFFSFLRIKLNFSGQGKLSKACLCYMEKKMDRPVATIEDGQEGITSVTIEQLIDRDSFPAEYSVCIVVNGSPFDIKCSRLAELERIAYQRSSLSIFREYIRDWRSRNGGREPTVLDIGGGPRSKTTLKSEFTGCDVKILDIVDNPEVDFVCDIHLMGDHLAHESVDFICSVSTFEHLSMPWKAAVEINKILKPDGLAFIASHQSVGLHDLPNDHFRFSDTSWNGLFNEATGFEILQRFMYDFVRIVPMHYFNVYEGYERSGGYCESSVIVKKTGQSKLDWPMDTHVKRETVYTY